mmetsp:Transcript_26262/g.60387  ORF Transcript_26262/g.60387 Transcript_26262/m.60387 type:complete len:214 (-) Transcript_26262:397-1038(-)
MGDGTRDETARAEHELTLGFPLGRSGSARPAGERDPRRGTPPRSCPAADSCRVDLTRGRRARPARTTPSPTLWPVPPPRPCETRRRTRVSTGETCCAAERRRLRWSWRRRSPRPGRPRGAAAPGRRSIAPDGFAAETAAETAPAGPACETRTGRPRGRPRRASRRPPGPTRRAVRDGGGSRLPRPCRGGWPRRSPGGGSPTSTLRTGGRRGRG